MLVIDVSKIPEEGLHLDEALQPSELRVDGEQSFTLEPGGRLVADLEKGDEDSVHVRGRLTATLGLTCGRCLDASTRTVDQALDLFYLPHRADAAVDEEDEVELSERDMVVAYYRGDRLDLGETVREQLYLAVPMRHLCRDDCKGICPRCGANRNTAPCNCQPEEPSLADPRLAELGKLFHKKS
jgi:uncharacterized protein